MQHPSGSVPIVEVLGISDPPLRVSGSAMKSVLAAWSLERYARHTQTVNLCAPLTLPVGQTRGRHCPQVWPGGRLDGPRYFAIRVRLGRSRLGPASTLVSKIRACARAQSPRVAHGLNSHTARAPSEVGVVDPVAGATSAVSMKSLTPPLPLTDTTSASPRLKSRRRDFVALRPHAYP